MAFLINFIKRIWDSLHEDDVPEIRYIPIVPEKPLEAPKPPQDAPLPVIDIDMPKQDMLTTFCTAMRDFEGKPGDLNYRNNNPGNYRFSPVGYLPKYEPVTKVGGFAHFPSYEIGWQYHLASVSHWAQLHPKWTILDFFTHYAPPSDNNPTHAYAQNVAKRCGVPVETTLEQLFK